MLTSGTCLLNKTIVEIFVKCIEYITVADLAENHIYIECHDIINIYIHMYDSVQPNGI